MPNDIDLKEEINKKVIEFLVASGYPVKDDASIYGWMDDDYLDICDHVKTCGLNLSNCSWVDSDWNEFVGTFAESPVEWKQGIDAVVSCNCYLLDGKHFRYTGSHADLIKGITEAE